LVNYVSIVDLININEIEDECDDEDTEENDDVSIGINEVGSIPLTFDSNFAPMDTEELNVYIQPE
jgi:hypothetical protein